MKQFVSFAIQISWHSNLWAALLSDMKMQLLGVMPRWADIIERPVSPCRQFAGWLIPELLSNPNSASLLLKYGGTVMSSNINRGAKWQE